MQRTDLQDTSPEAWQIMLKRLRELTPEERVRMTFERIEAAREFRKRTEHLRERPEKP
jgi:hypothetical protein